MDGYIRPFKASVVLDDLYPEKMITDFGVSDVAKEKLTELTVFTQFGEVRGTREKRRPVRLSWMCWTSLMGMTVPRCVRWESSCSRG